MSAYTSAAFWQATVERAVKTAAQTAGSLALGTWTGLLEVDWAQLGSVSGLAALLSVLTSIGSARIGGDGPSMGPEVTVPKDQA